jgi:hypothetical protein
MLPVRCAVLLATCTTSSSHLFSHIGNQKNVHILAL